jgi:hypothetical protein
MVWFRWFPFFSQNSKNKMKENLFQQHDDDEHDEEGEG